MKSADYVALEHAERIKRDPNYEPTGAAIAPDKQHRPPAFSDEALALRFAERHSADLRFVAAWNRWLSWDGRRWRFDVTLHAYDLARAICREAASECNKSKLSAAIASAKTVAAVERLARADRRIAATVEQWDMDPWALNTPNGVVDLRTGKMRPHRAEDYITQITAVAPGAECPLFLAFLARITDNDASLVSYLQRVLGYALTGLTKEHALFFLFGTGANGKSVFLSTVSGVLADYHKTAAPETFTVSHNDRHLSELARLRGARMVAVTETEEGRRWAESRIKQMTGGDVVAANFMRQDQFEFRPVFKLFVAGNHKPGLRSVDEAIRRRFNLIPFTVTIPPQERDVELVDKLKAEWPGIVAWMIQGCLNWQAQGLKPPRAVLDATEAYLSAEDAIAEWIDEKCECDPTAWASSSELYGSWASYAVQAGEHAGSQKSFSQSLESRGFRRHRMSRAQGFYGLRPRPEVDAAEYWTLRE
jgi:putative DNA primase/helicase